MLITGDRVIPLEFWNYTLPHGLPCPIALCPSFGDGKRLPSNFFNAECVLLHIIVINCSKYESKLLLDCGCGRLDILVLFGFYVTPLFSVCVLHVQERK